MLRRTSKALAATLALGAIAAATASAAAHVTLRIEGATRTLLQTTTVTVPTHGSISKFGAPAGACPASHYAGVIDRATRGHWAGTWSTQFGDYELNSLLGETHTFSSGVYWATWRNNRYTTLGICQQPVSNGDHLLIYADPTAADISPLALRTPHRVRAGRAFRVQVVSFNGSNGKASPVAGASVRGGSAVATTDRTGHATVTLAHAGHGTLRAVATGHVRSETERVSVSR